MLLIGLRLSLSLLLGLGFCLGLSLGLGLGVAGLGSSPAAAATERSTPPFMGNGVGRRGCVKPKNVGDGPQALVTPDQMKPDLRWTGAMTSSQQLIDLSAKVLRITYLAELQNAGYCRASSSRMKAILTLSGGSWLGEARVDMAVPPRQNVPVEFSIDVPLAKIVTADCDISRDDYEIAIYADFQDDVTEGDETNNEGSATFSTNSDNLGDICDSL